MDEREYEISRDPRGTRLRNTASALMLAAAALPMPAAVHAQAIDYGALEELFGEPVTMTVTGSPQRQSAVPVSMEIITAAEIGRTGARDLVGVLRHVAGVDFMQTTNDHADVSIRGYNEAFSSRLLVLVNGRQVYADYYGFTPWSTIPVEVAAIRQIEIVRGPNSALYGFNAVGGVINIVTYDPLTEEVDTASASIGTQSLSAASAVSTFRTGERTALRIMGGRRSDDDFSTPQKPFDVGSRRGNDRTAGTIEGVIVVNDDVRIDLEATDAHITHTELSPVLTTSHSRYDAESLKGAVTAETSVGLLEAVLYRNRIDGDIIPAGQVGPQLFFDSEVLVAQVQDIFKVGAEHTLRVSAEYRESSMATTPIAGGEVFYDIVSAAAMWQWQIDPSLTWTTAVRHDGLTLGRRGVIPPGLPIDNSLWERGIDKVSYNTGAVWHAGERDTFRFSVARGAQLPNLSDLGGYLDFIPFVGYVGGSPFIEPTIVRNVELGWVRRLPGVRGRLDVALFGMHNHDIESLIGGSRPDLGLIGVPANLGDSHSIGLTVSVDGAFGLGWRWGLSYTAQRIRDSLVPAALEEGITSFENTTPRHVFDGRVGWSGGSWEIDAFLRYQSRTNAVAVTDPLLLTGVLEPIPSYAAVNARVGYALTDRMTVALSSQNLTERTQRQTAAPEVERRLIGTFTFEF